MIEQCPTAQCPPWRREDGDRLGAAAPVGLLNRTAGLDRRPSALRLDRRLLERYAACPFQGWAVEMGLVEAASAEAESGGQVHRVIARAVRGWLEEGADPARCMAAHMGSVRPDVQADAAAALRPSARAIGRFLASLAPESVIAHRGGTGARSGRIARELPDAAGGRPVRIVSTVDLLYAGASPAEVHEIDFRSGRKILTASDVKSGLKFRVHAWCLFGAFPSLTAHHVRIWHTRTNALTPVVTFRPGDAALAGAAVARTLRARRDVCAALGRGAEAGFGDVLNRTWAARRRDFWWPELARCAACAACTRCPAALSPARDFAADPEAFLRDTAAMKAALDRRIALLRQTVRRTGRDLVFGRTAFGVCRPASPINPTARFYKPVEAQAETGAASAG
jgi:hypothetical protein